ncbi:MFS transporter, partial [Mycobacteroides abscessus subsp. abscessus]|nr:MFS transporter [Mycobacteroides abscessus subsp. abscessus]
PGKLDWAGTVTVALGLTVLLTGITYGIQPYGNSSTGWSNPLVYGSLIAGVALLVLFCVIEARVADPMLDIRLFKNRA